MKKFREFVDKKARQSKRQLGILKSVLEQNGMAVKDFIEEEEPYIFLKNPNGGTQFDGVRIYKIGDDICYRVQNEDRTHPYGKAYALEVEDMFNDLISDDEYDHAKAGQEIMKGLAEELRDFFTKSAQAEKELRAGEYDQNSDPLGKVIISPMGTDYSSKVTNSK